MSPRLTCQLAAVHPILLAMPNESVIAERGIECGEGWYALIDELLNGIERHCPDAGSSTRVVTQIKEKFGLLRVYATPSDDAIKVILDATEQKSATCCEQCGRDGQLLTSPFPQVRCENCRGWNASEGG